MEGEMVDGRAGLPKVGAIVRLKARFVELWPRYAHRVAQVVGYGRRGTWLRVRWEPNKSAGSMGAALFEEVR